MQPLKLFGLYGIFFKCSISIRHIFFIFYFNLHSFKMSVNAPTDCVIIQTGETKLVQCRLIISSTCLVTIQMHYLHVEDFHSLGCSIQRQTILFFSACFWLLGLLAVIFGRSLSFFSFFLFVRLQVENQPIVNSLRHLIKPTKV